MTPSPQRWKEKLSSEKRQYFSRTVAMPGRGTQGPPGLAWGWVLMAAPGRVMGGDVARSILVLLRWSGLPSCSPKSRSGIY